MLIIELFSTFGLYIYRYKFISQKIKILLVVPSLSIGGVSKSVIEICNLLDRNRIDIELLLLSKNTEMLSLKSFNYETPLYFLNYKNIESYSVLSYFKNYFFPSDNKKMYEQFNELVLRLNPDIIHFHTLPLQLNLVKKIPNRFKNKLIYTDHSVRISEGEYSRKATLAMSFLYSILYKPFHVIAVSKVVYDSLTKFQINNQNKKSYIVENGLNFNEYIPLLKKNDKILQVVYVSRICSKKGFEEFIVAWSILKYKGPKKLLIVGPDELNGQIQKLAADLGLIDEITFTGAANNILELLQDSQIGVFPSHKEGLPIALLEKMSMALPIVVSDIPELTNIIIDGENGLIFKKGNAIDLAKKIDMLLFDTDLRTRLGNNARKTVIEKFSKNNEIQEITRIYHLIYNLK